MLPKFTTALAIFGLLSLQSQAQLTVQGGATFFMQSGAQVTVQGNVDNAGTLNNDGNLRVQGNYTNTGSYTGTGTAGVLEMYGTGNATLAPGSSSIANLTINKTAATDVVKLGASTTVTTGFTLTNGVLTTDPLVTPAVALISPATTPYTFAAGKEVVGRVTRTGWTAGVSRVFNQPNMQVSTTGGTTPTDFTVNMIPNGDPTQAEREVKRVYGFANTGGAGFTADVRYPYMSGELNTNTEANLVPWRLVTSEWNARLTPVTRDAANDWVATTGVLAADLAQEWKLADPNYTMNVTAYLRGPWNGTNQNMNTGLNSLGYLPLSQPYNQTAFNDYNGGETVAAGFFAAHPNIVDWVLIETRKPASGLASDATFASVIGRKVGFLVNNGSVVDLDGTTPLAYPISKQGNSFVVVKHRNHLSIMSNSIASAATGTFTNDFSGLAGVYDNPVITPDPVQALPSSTKYGLWAGNANRDITVNAGDVALVKNNANTTTTGYVYGDVNMDGTVNAGDVGVTKISANGTAQTHTNRQSGNYSTNTPVKNPQSHIPNN